MSYVVKEIFYSLQGEGMQTGRAAVFCRFAGCNLWSGKESDRQEAVCQFCDTDFVVQTDQGNGKKYPTAEALVDVIVQTWHGKKCHGQPYVIFTGGEPLLQLNADLLKNLHQADFEIGVETNGTLSVLEGVDWICVSPKAHVPLKQTVGHELKLVFPQPEAPPGLFEKLDFQYFFLQPMDGENRDSNTQLAIQYCLEHPQWRLSLQTHKLLEIP